MYNEAGGVPVVVAAVVVVGVVLLAWIFSEREKNGWIWNDF